MRRLCLPSQSRHHRRRALVRTASLGYALPGTVLAIGLLTPLASLDNLIDGISRELVRHLDRSLAFGIGRRTGLRLYDPLSGNFGRWHRGRAGKDPARPRSQCTHAWPDGDCHASSRIHLPLLRPSAWRRRACWSFVDCMKELPATLLLRPLNFETLATHLYAEASRGTYEDGAVAALAIVLVGLLPVILLARSRSPGRQVRLARTNRRGYV